ncbi:MAG: GNAT family N-acetyltransferase [Kangiellaceae bacterium]|jgi:RimJ/RimL family protein N-acetyltransferase|nr:GNAT family N-acetyltransferase [Kangiellaceae bacterium]
MAFKLATDRLCLRHAHDDDATFIKSLFNQPECLKFIGDKELHTSDDARNYINDRLIQSYQINNFGLYIVERRTDGDTIGLCGLVKRDYFPIADLGFAQLNDFVGQGYMFEACKSVLDDCKQRLSLSRLLAITMNSNQRSLKLLDKLGFVESQSDRVNEVTNSDVVLSLSLDTP